MPTTPPNHRLFLTSSDSDHDSTKTCVIRDSPNNPFFAQQGDGLDELDPAPQHYHDSEVEEENGDTDCATSSAATSSAVTTSTARSYLQTRGTFTQERHHIIVSSGSSDRTISTKEVSQNLNSFEIETDAQYDSRSQGGSFQYQNSFDTEVVARYDELGEEAQDREVEDEEEIDYYEEVDEIVEGTEEVEYVQEEESDDEKQEDDPQESEGGIEAGSAEEDEDLESEDGEESEVSPVIGSVAEDAEGDFEYEDDAKGDTSLVAGSVADGAEDELEYEDDVEGDTSLVASSVVEGAEDELEYEGDAEGDTSFVASSVVEGAEDELEYEDGMETPGGDTGLAAESVAEAVDLEANEELVDSNETLSKGSLEPIPTTGSSSDWSDVGLPMGSPENPFRARAGEPTLSTKRRRMEKGRKEGKVVYVL